MGGKEDTKQEGPRGREDRSPAQGHCSLDPRGLQTPRGQGRTLGLTPREADARRQEAGVDRKQGLQASELFQGRPPPTPSPLPIALGLDAPQGWPSPL